MQPGMRGFGQSLVAALQGLVLRMSCGALSAVGKRATRRPLRPLLPLALGAVVSVCSRPAAALELHVRSEEPGLHYVLARSDGKVVDRCVGVCTLLAPPGSYWLWVMAHAESGVHRSRRRVELNQDLLLRVSPAYETPRSLGLFMGIGGPILIVGSLILGQRQGTTAVPLTGVGVGAIATAAGWSLFAANSSPSFDATPTRPRLSTAVVVLKLNF